MSYMGNTGKCVYHCILHMDDDLYVYFIGFFVFHQLSFSYVGMALPGFNQYKARINVSCSRTQGSDAGEARTPGPSVSSEAL